MSEFDSFIDSSNIDKGVDVDEEGKTDRVKVRVLSGKAPVILQNDDKTIHYFKLNDTVDSVKDFYLNHYNTEADNVKDIIFYASLTGAAELMDLNKKLKEYTTYVAGGFLVQASVYFTAHGGSDEKVAGFDIKRKPKHRERNIERSKRHKFSKEPCVISLEKHSTNNVVMPCGHTINSQSMFGYLLRVFNANDWQYRVFCPVSDCRKEWNFAYCTAVACLNEEEWFAFNDEIISRTKPVSKPCPNCRKDCVKPDQLEYHRVACICRKGDWCWECGKKWVGGGFTVCGNNGCITNHINERLKGCQTIRMLDMYDVPMIRACPFCHQITHYLTKCKHMHCKGCGKWFCFICLKGKDSKGSWQCGSAYGKCEDGVADKQIIK